MLISVVPKWPKGDNFWISVRLIYNSRWYRLGDQRSDCATRWRRSNKLGGTDFVNRGNRKLATQTRWHRSGIGCTDVLGFGMGLSEFGNRWHRVESVGCTDFGYLTLDRLLWKSLWVFLVTITCARMSILFTNKTLPPFNSIGFPMDSKWFLTNVKCRVLFLEALPTYFLASWGISTISTILLPTLSVDFIWNTLGKSISPRDNVCCHELSKPPREHVVLSISPFLVIDDNIQSKLQIKICMDIMKTLRDTWLRFAPPKCVQSL